MEEELWLAGMSKVHAKIWADKYDELGRIADSRKVVIEGLEAENKRLKIIAQAFEDQLDRLAEAIEEQLEDGSPLVKDLIIEFERARRQWDEYQKTGVSTAHFGCYDLCISPILKKHLKI